MEDAVQILVANERGKLFLCCPPDLAPALAQFRRDKLQAERLVDRLLRRDADIPDGIFSAAPMPLVSFPGRARPA